MILEFYYILLHVYLVEPLKICNYEFYNILFFWICFRFVRIFSDFSFTKLCPLFTNTYNWIYIELSQLTVKQKSIEKLNKLFLFYLFTII